MQKIDISIGRRLIHRTLLGAVVFISAAASSMMGTLILGLLPLDAFMAALKLEDIGVRHIFALSLALCVLFCWTGILVGTLFQIPIPTSRESFIQWLCVGLIYGSLLTIGFTFMLPHQDGTFAAWFIRSFYGLISLGFAVWLIRKGYILLGLTQKH